MFGLILFPQNYGGRAVDKESRVKIEDTEHLQEKLKELRKTVSGKFAMQMFEEYRFKTIHWQDKSHQMINSYVRTICTEIVITTDRDCGSSSYN